MSSYFKMCLSNILWPFHSIEKNIAWLVLLILRKQLKPIIGVPKATCLIRPMDKLARFNILNERYLQVARD